MMVEVLDFILLRLKDVSAIFNFGQIRAISASGAGQLCPLNSALGAWDRMYHRLKTAEDALTWNVI